MTVETLSKEALRAVQHFEDKLNFETNPFGLNGLIQQGEPLQIIDLRVKELYDKGHIPGAINIAYEELEKKANQLSKDKTTVVYCYNLLCALATRAALLLASKGFKVKELIGGYEEWHKTNATLENKLPVETKGTSSCCSHDSSCA